MASQYLTAPVFELCTDDGGQIAYSPARRLIHRLNDSKSLDHTHFTPESLNYSGGLPMFVILHRGNALSMDFDRHGNQLYLEYYLDSGNHWLAGVCRLYFPDSQYPTEPNNYHTVHLLVSLLPLAREKGFGRAAVNKLLEHAFEALRVRRVVAPIVCPAHPNDSEADKKKAIHETKRLCWVFEQYGFKFEGISRGEVANPRVGRHESPVWQDVYRMSMLDTDYLARQMLGLFSGGIPRRDADCPRDPYESMAQRQEQEKRDMVALGCAPVERAHRESEVVEDDDDDYDSDECEDSEGYDTE